MQPQQNLSQPSLPPTPIQPQPPVENNNAITKKAKTVRRSNIALGVLIIITSLITLLAATQEPIPVIAPIAALIYLIGSIALIVLSTKLKPSVDIARLKALIFTMAMVSIAMVIVGIIKSFIQIQEALGLTGLLYFINFVYLIVVRARL